MLQRQYTAPNFRGQDNRSFRGVQVAQADTRVQPDLIVGDVNWKDRLFSQLGSQGVQTLNRMADIEFSNQYLEGAAKAGMIESEDEIQGNPLTRDWQLAGYRDTMGKLSLADMEAKFMQDLPLLREKGPEAMQEYLTNRRAEMLPHLSGMSREARAAAAGQMLLQDRSATKQWTSEHTKFIIEQKSQAVISPWGVMMQGLSDAQLKVATGQTSDDVLQEQLRNTAGFMVGAVWEDKSFPTGVKSNLTADMITAALASDNVSLYEYMAATPIKDGEGSSTILSRLDSKQQIQLTNQYREAMQRTNDARNLFRAKQVANIEAQIDAGTFQGTLDDLDETLAPMVLNKSMKGSERQSLLNKFLDKQLKQEETSALGDAMLRGDIDSVIRSGKSPAQGMDAVDAMLTKRGFTPEQRLDTYLEMGQRGVDEGYKRAGTILSTAVSALMNSPDGVVLEQHGETFRKVMNRLQADEASGKAYSRATMLSGLGEDQRMFVERVMRKRDADRSSLDEATMWAKDLAAKDAALSPSVRAAKASQDTKDIISEVNAMDARGLLSSLWSGIKGIVSADSANDLILNPTSRIGSRDGWFGDNPAVGFYVENTRRELLAEVNNVRIVHPGSTAAEAISVAKANLAARTIPADSPVRGPIILPRNADLQTIFGVAPGNQAAIGPAIDGMLNSTKANTRWQVSFAQGQLFAQEVDNNGQRVGSGMYITPQSVQTRIQEDTAKNLKQADHQFGGGKTVTKGELSIRFNGLNSAGVPTGWMFGFRDNLVQNEGIVDKPMDDLSGNKDKRGKLIQTVGVGVSSTNDFFPNIGPDGKVTSQAASESFMRASDAAAKAGQSVAAQLGKTDKAAFMLLSELAYQSGPDFATRKGTTGDRYRNFNAAFASGDVEAAKAAFKGTAAWYYSRNPDKPNEVATRQKHYLRLIEQSMKG